MRSGVRVHALALDADVPGVDGDRHGERRVEPLPAPRLGQLAVWNNKKRNKNHNNGSLFWAKMRGGNVWTSFRCWLGGARVKKGSGGVCQRGGGG